MFINSVRFSRCNFKLLSLALRLDYSKFQQTSHQPEYVTYKVVADACLRCIFLLCWSTSSRVQWWNITSISFSSTSENRTILPVRSPIERFSLRFERKTNHNYRFRLRWKATRCMVSWSVERGKRYVTILLALQFTETAPKKKQSEKETESNYLFFRCLYFWTWHVRFPSFSKGKLWQIGSREEIRRRKYYPHVTSPHQGFPNDWRLLPWVLR